MCEASDKAMQTIKVNIIWFPGNRTIIILGIRAEDLPELLKCVLSSFRYLVYGYIQLHHPSKYRIRIRYALIPANRTI